MPASLLVRLLLGSCLLAAPPVLAQDAPPPPGSEVPTGPRVTLKAVNFSAANTATILSFAADLQKRMEGFGADIEVILELTPQANGVLVTVERRIAGPDLGLQVKRGPAGMYALDYSTAQLMATSVNAWLVLGPMRDAATRNNIALFQAFQDKAFLMRFENPAGMILNLPFYISGNGLAVFEGLVWVLRDGKPVQVSLDPRTGLLPPAVGADGRRSPSAEVLSFFAMK